MTQYTDTLTDTISSLDTMDEGGAIYGMSQDEFTSIADPDLIYEGFWAWHGELADTSNMSSTDKLDYGAVVLDEVSAGDTTAIKMLFNDVAAELLGMQDRVYPATALALADTTNISPTVAVATGLAIIDALGLTDTLLPKMTFGMSYTDVLRLTDGLYRFFSGDVVEGIAISESLINKINAYPVLADAVTLTDTSAQALIFRVTTTDGVALDDVDVLQLIYSDTISDNIEIVAGYVSPDGNFTAWTINTKNFATTEYTNYAFNSLAQLGLKYIGATSEGLYELDGDTDAGDDIIARIKSGFMQLGGSRFTGFKSAYIGARGTGDYVLKLETGDGKTYVYNVVGKDMQSAKAHFGKGLRARYFAFDLISTGPDFDLDSIEFLPLVMQRRV